MPCPIAVPLGPTAEGAGDLSHCLLKFLLMKPPAKTRHVPRGVVATTKHEGRQAVDGR
jgi:hypothetical protein